MNFFSACFFGHGDAIKDFARDPQGQIIEPKRFVFRCLECQQELRQPLQDQQFRQRKERKTRRTKAKSADVLTLTRKVG
jgi:hypothetical protein